MCFVLQKENGLFFVSRQFGTFFVFRIQISIFLIPIILLPGPLPVGYWKKPLEWNNFHQLTPTIVVQTALLAESPNNVQDDFHGVQYFCRVASESERSRCGWQSIFQEIPPTYLKISKFILKCIVLNEPDLQLVWFFFQSAFFRFGPTEQVPLPTFCCFYCVLIWLNNEYSSFPTCILVFRIWSPRWLSLSLY